MTEEKPKSKGGQTRALLIETAHALFMEKGYHATSMRHIAERAGLALGGIYNHFASKEEMFAAVLEAYHPYKRIIPKLEQAEGETIEAFVRDSAHRMQVEVAGVEHQIVPLALIELVEFQGKHLAAMVQQNFPVLLAYVQKFSQRKGRIRSIPLPVMLRMFFATFVGYLFTDLVLRRVPLFKEMGHDWFDGMIDIYLHGILEPEV